MDSTADTADHTRYVYQVVVTIDPVLTAQTIGFDRIGAEIDTYVDRAVEQALTTGLAWQPQMEDVHVEQVSVTRP